MKPPVSATLDELLAMLSFEADRCLDLDGWGIRAICAVEELFLGAPLA